MFKKAQIISRLIKNFSRSFQVKFTQNQASNAIQYHSGGDDYNPPNGIEALGGNIGNNPAHSIILAYKDNVNKVSAPGEKRIYATDESGKNIMAEIHLKNDGDIILIPKGKIISSGTLEHTGNAKIIGTLTADNIVSNNGATGTFANSVGVQSGIVTRGS